MMKKVLFLIGSLQGGGAEKVLVDTVNSLDSDRYQITVQTLFDEGIYRERLSGYVQYRSIIRCRTRFMKKILGKLLFFMLPTRLVYNCFIRREYDYEIAFLEGLPTKLIAASTNEHAEKIAWIHTDLNNNPGSCRAFSSKKKEQQAYHCFDKVFCVSKAVENAFISKYGPIKAKVGTLYNVLDDAAVIAASRENVTMPGTAKPCFISVGRLVQAKGYDRLLRIHKQLIDDGLMHSMLIIGDGEQHGELEAFIAANDLQNTVSLIGFQNNPYKYISKADLFICSSYAEGFSTVVTESVLCGTPVITTDVSGSREPVDVPRCSVVVENSETGLYEGLRSILFSPELTEQFRADMPIKQAFFKKERLLEAFEKSVFG